MATVVTPEKKATLAELRKAWWIWIFFNLSAFSMERMQSPAFVYMMSPFLRKFYGDNPGEFKAALKRHMVFFNTEPQTGVIAHGVTIALEEQRANGAPIDDDMINAVKTGIMGPMAGIGDSLIPGTLIPILLAIGMSLSLPNGNPIGPIFYIIFYTVIILAISYYLFMFGYRYGMQSMRELAEGGFRRMTTSFQVLGLIVAGGIGAGIISLTTPLAYNYQEVSIKVQDQLNNIFPGLLGFLLVLWLWDGMRRRGWPINRALGMTFLVVLLGYIPYLIAVLLDVFIDHPFLDFLRGLRVF